MLDSSSTTKISANSSPTPPKDDTGDDPEI